MPRGLNGTFASESANVPISALSSADFYLDGGLSCQEN